jgi:hypothetical protein
MTEAVNRIGGTTRLTEAELARVSATATEAVAKMKALGIDVPPAIQKLASSVQHAKEELGDMEGSAVRTGKATQGLGDQLSQVDGVLGAFGVHLGPEVKALRELGEHSDKTASQLGLLGTVALAAGAAIGGWKLGRLIAEFTGSDEAIGNATAKLLGWTTADGWRGIGDRYARARERHRRPQHRQHGRSAADQHRCRPQMAGGDVARACGRRLREGSRALARGAAGARQWRPLVATKGSRLAQLLAGRTRAPLWRLHRSARASSADRCSGTKR